MVLGCLACRARFIVPRSLGALHRRTWQGAHVLRTLVDSASDSPKLTLSAVGSQLLSSKFRNTTPEAAYDNWASTYEDDSCGEQGLGFDSPNVCARIAAGHIAAAAAGRDAPVRVLDVGCGTGLLGGLLDEHLRARDDCQTELVGCDLSAGMLDLARAAGRYAALHKCSASDVPWPLDDGVFDVAMCNGVLVYVADNLAGTLGEFCRVLAPGGHAVLMLRDDDVERWAGAIEALEHDGQWRRVDVTEPRDNFKNAPSSDEGGSEERIMYRIHTFQKLQ